MWDLRANDLVQCPCSGRSLGYSVEYHSQGTVSHSPVLEASLQIRIQTFERNK